MFFNTLSFRVANNYFLVCIKKKTYCSLNRTGKKSTKTAKQGARYLNGICETSGFQQPRDKFLSNTVRIDMHKLIEGGFNTSGNQVLKTETESKENIYCF